MAVILIGGQGAPPASVNSTFVPAPVVGPTPAPSTTSSPPTLPRFKAAVAGVKAGTRKRAKWLALGDSLTAGYKLPNGRQDCLTSQLVTAFSTTARTQDWSILGDHNISNGGYQSSFVQSYDPRNVFGPNWYSSGPYGLGGNALGEFSSDSGTWAYTAPSLVDSVDIYYQQDSGQGSFDVKVNGSLLGTVNTTGNAALQKASYTFTRGTNTVTVATAAGGSAGVVKIIGFDTYDSTLPAVSIYNGGIVGATTANYVDTSSGKPYALFSAIPSFAADLVTIELGANDANGSVSSSTYQANLQTLITQAKLSGTADVLLIKPHPANPMTDTYNVPASYLAAIDALTASNGLPPAADFSTAGLVAGDYIDTIHLAASGYAKEAPLLAQKVAGLIS